MPKNTGSMYAVAEVLQNPSVALYAGVPRVTFWKNFLLEFDVQAHPLGSGPSWAGWDVVLRMSLPDGDVVTIDEGGSNLRLSERVAGSWFTRAVYGVNWQANRWYTVRTKIQDASITVWVNGVQAISYGALVVKSPGCLVFNDGVEMDGGQRSYRATRLEVLP